MDLSFTSEEQAFAAEVRDWLAANLERPPAFGDLDEEIAWGRDWQAKLAAARWVGLHWPERYGGRGASPLHVAIFNTEYARARAPQPVNRVGLNLAGPTLLDHGSDEQQQRWLPPILTAEEIWCQLFSEPDAGSDLAGLRTEARQAEAGWVLSGQKVWTSYARHARWGLCLARTNPAAPKHRGISYLVVDMRSRGVEVRPLHQITGEAEFNEVFLDDVFVPADHLVGPLDAGWTVANTTLAHERGTSFPFKEQVVHEVLLDELYGAAAARGLLDNPLIAEELAQAFVEVRLLRLHNWRTLTRLAHGAVPGAESSWIKLTWSDMSQHLSQLALDVLGPEGALATPPARQWLWSKAASIAGGTSEIQRTIIGERVLGLPRP
ncbi:MAG: acyl-CoA dehydrogenase family protein [Acidimicrobiales bacterium]